MDSGLDASQVGFCRLGISNADFGEPKSVGAPE
jgi:hypothetical protein